MRLLSRQARAVLAALVAMGSSGCSMSSGVRSDAGDDAHDTGASDTGADGPRADAAFDASADAHVTDAGAADSTTDAPATDGPVDAGPVIDAPFPDGWSPDSAANPELFALAVSPLALTPSFSPSVHDYYVRCAAGENPLDVTMTASPGAEVGVAVPAAYASNGQSHVSVQLTENQALVVAASLGAATSSYWIRCLPHDFPQLQMTTRENVTLPPDGYFLVGDVLFATGESGYAMALDVRGVPVWYAASTKGVANVDSPAPDTLTFLPYLPYTFTDFSGSYEIDALSPASITYVTPNMAPLDLHELRVLPNGDSLVLTWPITTGVDLTGLSTYGANEDMIGCGIQELNAAGQTVWQWSATDHLDPVKDCTYPFIETVADTTGTNQNVVDPFHCNSLDVDANGDILVSARHMDAVFLVTKATGKIAWTLGGTGYTKDGAPSMQVTGDALTSFYRQHDARFLPDGTISMFDDQSGKAGPARALVLSTDLTAGTASVVWQRAGVQSSLAMGSFRILPDGSRTIGWGWITGSTSSFTEVDATGLALRDFTFPDGDITYRAIKVPLSELDLDVMRAAAGATN